MDIDAIATQVRQHGEALAKLDPEKLAKLDPEKLNNTVEQAFRSAMQEAQREFGGLVDAMEERIKEVTDALTAERETRETVVAELTSRIVTLEGYSRSEVPKGVEEPDPGPTDSDEEPAKKKKPK